MKTPERLNALRTAKKNLRIRDQKIVRMRQQLESVTSVKGIQVDSELMKEMEEVINSKSSEMEQLTKSDFKRIFWDQQVV